ncbi:MAG: hypothetical protein NW217_04720 [Hyphomicrobiaceae bacterium]|nr:hypothetical protein [Hyphomicrobiaceae bacterium]
MKRLMIAASLLWAASVLADTALAGERYRGGYYGMYRSGPQVKGFVARRGGYSYTYADSINTTGNSRSNYGGVNSLRDPFTDRQTNSGPFDHGFFFDSGVAPRGGDSPYQH